MLTGATIKIEWNCSECLTQGLVDVPNIYRQQAVDTELWYEGVCKKVIIAHAQASPDCQAEELGIKAPIPSDPDNWTEQ